MAVFTSVTVSVGCSLRQGLSKNVFPQNGLSKDIFPQTVRGPHSLWGPLLEHLNLGLELTFGRMGVSEPPGPLQDLGQGPCPCCLRLWLQPTWQLRSIILGQWSHYSMPWVSHCAMGASDMPFSEQAASICRSHLGTWA